MEVKFRRGFIRSIKYCEIIALDALILPPTIITKKPNPYADFDGQRLSG